MTSPGRWTGPVRSPVSNPLIELIPDEPPVEIEPGIKLEWCTVTSAFPDPVQLVPDGPSTDPLPGVPFMLCKVVLGDRVLVMLVARRMYVIGKGQPDQSVDSNDSGWITDSISFLGSAYWSVTTYRCRLVGNRATLQMNLSYSGPTITVGSTGNIPDQAGILVIPPEWAPSSGTYYQFGQLYQTGVSTSWCRVSSNGSVDLTNGVSGATLPASPSYYLYFDYYVD